MKIIALYPVLQDRLNINFLKVSILSLYNFVDEIIVLFDTPNNKKKLKKDFFNKRKKISIYFSKRKQKKTNAPIQELLNIGRKHKGSHFIFLDADEAFTFSLGKNLKKILKNLKKGEKIQLHWMSVWKNHKYIRIDKKSVWSNIYKDFIYYDNKKDNFKEFYVDTNRTPGTNTSSKLKKIHNKYGGVMHLQFINWKNYLFKQAWYMCKTLVIDKSRNFKSTTMDTGKINRMYFYTYFENYPKLELIDKNEIYHIPKKFYKDLYIDNSKFWEKKFNFFFKKHDIKKFEDLNIWHISFLKNLFYKKVKRYPRKNISNKIIFFLFLILEIIRNLYRKFKI